jgi:hypothetical protein
LDKILEEADREGRGQYRRQVDPKTGREVWVDGAGDFIAEVNQQLDDIEKYLRS